MNCTQSSTDRTLDWLVSNFVRDVAGVSTWSSPADGLPQASSAQLPWIAPSNSVR